MFLPHTDPIHTFFLAGGEEIPQFCSLDSRFLLCGRLFRRVSSETSNRVMNMSFVFIVFYNNTRHLSYTFHCINVGSDTLRAAPLPINASKHRSQEIKRLVLFHDQITCSRVRL